MLEDIRAYLDSKFPATRLPARSLYEGNQGRAERDPEIQEMLRLLKDKTWQELAPDVVRILADYLTFMGDDALKAYIAAFLSIGTEDLRKGDESVISAVLFSLTPTAPDGRPSAFHERRVRLFSRTEGEAIAQVLRTVAELPISEFLSANVERAMDSYWGRMLTGSPPPSQTRNYEA